MTIEYGSKLSRITEPAPITQPWPIFIPERIIECPPTQTSDPISKSFFSFVKFLMPDAFVKKLENSSTGRGKL